jgi:sec-independent protein translocase protein TatB
MFGIGFSELVLIGLILIIFIKPEDLPKFFRSAGKLYGRMKRAYDDIVTVKDKILKEIDDAVALEDKTAEKAAADAKAAPAPQQNADAKNETPAALPPEAPLGDPVEEAYAPEETIAG